jgi:hypothetical protein
MQIQNCVSISQVVSGVVVRRLIPKMGNCDFCASGFKQEAEAKDVKTIASNPGTPQKTEGLRHPRISSVVSIYSGVDRRAYPPALKLQGRS